MGPFSWDCKSPPWGPVIKSAIRMEPRSKDSICIKCYQDPIISWQVSSWFRCITLTLVECALPIVREIDFLVNELGEKISKWHGELVLEGQYIHTSTDKKQKEQVLEFFTAYRPNKERKRESSFIYNVLWKCVKSSCPLQWIHYSLTMFWRVFESQASWKSSKNVDFSPFSV